MSLTAKVLETGHALTVLVADDNVDGADSLAMVLGLAGHTVQVAYDGTEAIKLAQMMHPNAAVLDLCMPGVSGFEVAQWIRRQFWGARTRLIAVSGWSTEQHRAQSAAAGFDLHLGKPADPTQIERLLLSP